MWYGSIIILNIINQIQYHTHIIGQFVNISLYLCTCVYENMPALYLIKCGFVHIAIAETQ